MKIAVDTEELKNADCEVKMVLPKEMLAKMQALEPHRSMQEIKLDAAASVIINAAIQIVQNPHLILVKILHIIDITTSMGSHFYENSVKSSNDDKVDPKTLN